MYISNLGKSCTHGNPAIRRFYRLHGHTKNTTLVKGSDGIVRKSSSSNKDRIRNENLLAQYIQHCFKNKKIPSLNHTEIDMLPNDIRIKIIQLHKNRQNKRK